MEKLAHRLAVRIHAAGSGTVPLPVLANGLTYMLMSLTIVCVSLFVGILTGRAAETVICLFCFSTLRRLTGGRHMKTVSRCVAFSSVLMIMLAHLPVRDETVILAMNLFGLACVLLFAPTFVSTEAGGRRRRLLLKAAAAGLVCGNFFFANAQAALAFAAQGLLLIPGRKEECAT